MWVHEAAANMSDNKFTSALEIMYWMEDIDIIYLEDSLVNSKISMFIVASKSFLLYILHNVKNR